MNNSESYRALRRFWCIPRIQDNLYVYLIIVFFIFVNVCMLIAGFWLYANDYDCKNNSAAANETVGYRTSAIVFVILLFILWKWRVGKFNKKAGELRSYGILESVADDFGRNRNNLFLNNAVLGETYMIFRSGYMVMPYSVIESAKLIKESSDNGGVYYFIFVESSDPRFKRIRIPTKESDFERAKDLYLPLRSFIYQKNSRVIVNIDF